MFSKFNTANKRIRTVNDLKKTFLAGFFVLFILLLTPYYLQLIGYQDVVVIEDNAIDDRLDSSVNMATGSTFLKRTLKEVPIP